MTQIPRHATRIYMDTSAFSRLWGHPDFAERALLRLRRRLTSPLFERRPVLLISGALLGELAAAHQSAVTGHRLREQIEFIHGCAIEIPLQTIDCIRAEVLGDRAFASGDQLDVLLKEVQRGGPVVAEEHRFHSAMKLSFLHSEESRRKEMVRRIGSQRALGPQAAQWLGGLSRHVNSRVNEIMRQEARKWGLPRDESKWPSPREIPTLWAMVSYQFTRLALLHRDGRRIDENDALDWRHFHSASHADRLIVEDRRLREIAELCPRPRPDVLDFPTWARDCLS